MKRNGYYLGIDIGSISTNLVMVDETCNIVEKLYMRTVGQPINVLNSGLRDLVQSLGSSVQIKGVGTTGSGRNLANIIVGADIVKNEITAHAVAAQKIVPDARTVLEIGGQDSKIIILRNGIVYDFAMNTVCAAGTGSFLDRQASRLEIPIEDFGGYALRSNTSVRIAGRCAVFAESDMIHKQQEGHTIEDIIRGLCDALVRNYLTNVGKGKDIQPPVVFQGGVAANVGILAAFEKELGIKVVVPEYYDVMGAFGAALIAKKKMSAVGNKSRFFGFQVINNDYRVKTVECSDCSNMCEVVEMTSNDEIIACWGDRCGKWSQAVGKNEVVG